MPNWVPSCRALATRASTTTGYGICKLCCWAKQNHRNDLAHGFTRQMDSVVAVLLLRASALFLVMPLEAATAAEVDQLKARPTPPRPPEARPFLVPCDRGLVSGGQGISRAMTGCRNLLCVSVIGVTVRRSVR